jgi:hypothetical protein
MSTDSVKKKIGTIYIGADPEFFIRRHNHLASAHVLPFGTKKKPTATPYGGLQVDGIAVEFNTKPARDQDEFRSTIRAQLQLLNQLIGPAYVLYKRPAVYVGDRFLEGIPEENRKLGCDPDFNAYTMEINPTPNAKTNLRTAAGHIHIGWISDPRPPGIPPTREHFNLCVAMAKELDVRLGLPCLTWETDPRRRRLYGKAGAFRPKPYGMEYRTPSNEWLYNPNCPGAHFIWRTAYSAACAVLGKGPEALHLRKDARDVQSWIDLGMADWQSRAPSLNSQIFGV